MALDPAAFDPGDDALHGKSSHLYRVLGDGRQPHRRQCGRLTVVPTDHGQLGRYLDVLLRQQSYRGYGRVVVVGKEGRRQISLCLLYTSPSPRDRS